MDNMKDVLNPREDLWFIGALTGIMKPEANYQHTHDKSLINNYASRYVTIIPE